MKLIRTIYGPSSKGWSKYLTRIYLTPHTRWGSGKLHIFHRGDEDPDLHDHPWDFWTFPLTSYYEMIEKDGEIAKSKVKAFRLHYRPATYKHRVVQDGDKKIITFIWNKNGEREWGFWRDKKFIPWRVYLGE